MSDSLSELWSAELSKISGKISDMAKISRIASGFNSNIDAIINISGKSLAEIIKKNNISYAFLNDQKNRSAEEINDVIRGIFKCFTQGIAEEWTSTNHSLSQEVLSLFPADKMQIGGQAGIMANLLSLCKIKQVIVHTNSLPKQQALQFLPNDNLLGFDENGGLQQISAINRKKDIPLIHIIFEFKKDDSFKLFGRKFVCPKSNRFIVSCDELNQNMVLDEHFIKYIKNNHLDYFFLSGFHMLDSSSAKIKLPQIKSIIQELKSSTQKNCLVHLEIASTSDKKTRKMIIEDIGKIVDSLGLNDRETIDLMEAICPDKNFKPTSCDMFEAIKFLQQYTGCPRIELHMLGLFMTIQSKNYQASPQKTKDGMLLAARIANSKATLGDFQKYDDLLYSNNVIPSDIGIQELQNLADYLGSPEMIKTGFYGNQHFDLIVIPVPLAAKPKSLVGMGDTISAVSLIGAN